MSAGAQQSSRDTDTFVDTRQKGFLAQNRQMALRATDPNQARQLANETAAGVQPGVQASFGNIASLTDPTAQIAAGDASLQSGLAQLFNQTILPGIDSAAIQAGGFGGGRQGVAQGVASGQLAQAFTQGHGDIVANANRTATGAAALIPGLSQNLFDISGAGGSAAMDVLSQLAAILGQPTILERTRQRSSQVEAGII